MANVALRNIKKSYSDVDMIHGVDLDISTANSWSLSGRQAAASPRCCG